MDQILAVVPAAGQGSRMNSKLNKQYLSLLDKPVVAHTIETLENCDLINEIIVVACADEIDYCKQEVIKQYNCSKVSKVISGGASRQQSVYQGLQAVNEADYVLVHDGARPLITESILQQAIKEVKINKAVGVAVPVKDTIKIVDEEGYVVQTPNRDQLWAIQTPQVFAYQLIMKAYQQAAAQKITATDSSQLVEEFGQRVKLVQGSYENLKVTTPEDLIIAEAIMQRRI
ncbi:MAG: 2-C-methyl-D-erythritol 4-phosphate cytidylyltransferase [Bacillota bacterium]